MIDNQTAKPIAPSVQSRAAFFAFVLITFAGYIAIDVLTPCYFDDPWPAVFLMIQVVGQLTLICVWGTLVEGTFWFRLPWTLLLLVISWAALCCGVYLDDGQISSAEIMGMGLVWLYGFAISYIPLKIAAWLFGWRIRLVRAGTESNFSKNYAIRDIMTGTAILAVTLAIGRRLIPGELPRWQDVLSESSLDHSISLIAFLIFSLVSLIVKLPCIWIALAAPQTKVLWQSITWVFCAGLFGLLELIILAAVAGDLGPSADEFLISLTLGHSAMAITMIVVLYGLRYFGYRMSRVVKKSPESIGQPRT